MLTNPNAMSADGEAQAQELQLWMHPKSKTGWWYCEPVTDHDVILKVLVETARAEKRHLDSRRGQGPVILPLFSGQYASTADKAPTGMHVSNSAKAAVKVKPQNLTNNEWLRKQHIVNGHCGATRLIKIVLAMAAAQKLSPEDWKLFLRQGCGACDSFKLRMPSVGPSLKDKTPLAPCKG